MFMQVYSWLNPRKSSTACSYLVRSCSKLLLQEQERATAITSNKKLEEIISKESQRIKIYRVKNTKKSRVKQHFTQLFPSAFLT